MYKFYHHPLVPIRYRLLILSSLILSLATGLFDALSISTFYDITSGIQRDTNVESLIKNLIIFGGFTIIAYACKISLLWLNIWLSFRLAGLLNIALIQKSINIKNNSELVSDTLNDVTRVTELVSVNYILGVLKLISGIVVGSIIIGSLLTTSNGSATFLIFTLICFYVILSFSMKKLFQRSAFIISNKTKETVSLAKSILASRETISALSKTFEISDYWYKADYQLKTAMIKSQFSANSPRLFVELFGLVLIIMFVVVQPETLELVLAEVALLAIAAQRLLPILQQIYSSQSSIRISKQMFDSIYRRLPNKLLSASELSQKSIESICLNIHLKSGSYQFKLSKGSILKINGPSGSGKTTLLRSIIGLSKLTDVQIQVNEQKVENLIGSVAYSSQATNLFSGTLRENITLFQEISETQFNKLINICHLDEVLIRLGDNRIDPDGTELSGGERQRIFLARNLAIDADIIILDEAFVGLNDELAREILKKILLEFGQKIFVVVDHSNIFENYQCEVVNV